MTAWMRRLLILACLACVWAPEAWTEETPTVVQQPDYVEAAMGRYNLHPAFAKLGRGVANAFVGWVELPWNINARYSSTDPIASACTGAAYGLVKGLVRTGVGVYEAVTFFLPYPENFAPILPPLEYFQRNRTSKPLPIEY